ncbi:MAG: DUF1015 domain-containing protein [Candidatus Schekmanbacteria bacterium]|nr:MAG: DUF1015 domain-containing protein [Candidatus Schekmanbacteria bacterium]
MVDIRAFKGFVYDSKKVKIENVVAPPYDVISQEEQERLYELDEHNVVRLVLGKIFDDDNDSDNRYTRAARFLEDWLDRGIIKRHKEDSIYIYEQEFTLPDGRIMNRSGFIALASIEEPGKGNIFPHENTLSKPKEDRLKLMRSCQGNLCQIFSLFPDKERKVDSLLQQEKRQAPIFDFYDNNRIRNRLWQISHIDTVEKIRNEMSEKKLFIADGHHRYETAVNYMKEMREKDTNYTGNEPYNFVMMMFVNTYNEGLAVLPIHRLIHSVEEFKEETFLKRISEAFEVERVEGEGWENDLSDMLKKKGEKRTSFAVVFKDSGNNYIISVKDNEIIENYFDSSFPEELKSLDVTILHKVILENFLGIDEESLRDQKNVTYIKDWNRSLRMLKEGDYQAAFLLNATPVEAVTKVAEKGLRMPQKSTFFYPKLLTGLVFNLFRS